MKTNTRGQLRALRDRVTPKRLESLMDKREYRASVSREHAKTRGIAAQAFNNTIHLHRQLRYGLWSCWIGLIGLYAYVLYIVFVRL